MHKILIFKFPTNASAIDEHEQIILIHFPINKFEIAQHNWQ